MKDIRQKYGISKWLDSITDQDGWAILLYLWCFSLIIFAFPYTFPRFGEACEDFGIELARFGADFINVLIGTELTVPESGLLVKSEWVGTIDLPIFNVEMWRAFWAEFTNMDNFRAWIVSLAPKIRTWAYVGMLVLPVGVVLAILAKQAFTTYHGEMVDSKPLALYKRFEETVLAPSKAVLADFVEFLHQNRAYKYVYVGVLLFACNIPTVVLEALSWYFYILVTFDVGALYMAVYKLFADILPAVFFVPFGVWCAIGAVVLDKVRTRAGYAILDHHEAQNKGFIASLPLVNFVWGTMGSKKTTLLTDMALSYSALFRFKAYEMLLECDLLFPQFPWLCFERAIRAQMALSVGEEGRVYNLLSAGRLVAAIKVAYEAGDFDLWGYDGPTENPDGLVVNDLFEVLSDYAKLYFIYVISSTLLISNYGIREDADFYDLGNFPQWSFDFFRKDPRLSQACSRHSHIIDHDLFRLGKRVVSDNVGADGFEFGIVCITEIGKERGNMVENKRYKVDDEDANPLNDRLNDMLKLIRHFATVRHFPFVTFLVDDQRPDSWGADARELSQLIRVQECTNKHCAQKMRFVDDYINDFACARFEERYKQYRYYRADNTLMMYAYKRFVSWFHHRYVIAHNTFDYYKAELAIENGTREGGEDVHPYYLSTKKVYSDRFATDAFCGFVEARVARSTTGIDDMPTYGTTHATIEEMRSSNSYLINTLTKYLLCETQSKRG